MGSEEAAVAAFDGELGVLHGPHESELGASLVLHYGASTLPWAHSRNVDTEMREKFKIIHVYRMSTATNHIAWYFSQNTVIQIFL